jgi:hypothetical protein
VAVKVAEWEVDDLVVDLEENVQLAALALAQMELRNVGVSRMELLLVGN